MRKLVIAAGLFVVATAVSYFFLRSQTTNVEIKPKPLEKYSIENLAKRGGVASQITYNGKMFYFYSEGKKISGVVNYPQKSNGKIVVLLHGSADDDEYFPGFGTQKVAQALAKNGYTTYAPDFAGYGESDPRSADDFQDRFQTYTTTLDLIASIGQSSKLKTKNSNDLSLDFGISNLFLWGHSNGGQIALTVLAITGQPYPTVLWNPVTKPFPYNILYFTDGYEDEGRWLRSATAKFETDYDVDKYSFEKYLDRITAPIFLQQGEADEWVPVRWNREFSKKFPASAADGQKAKLIYKEYPGANHNLVPGWDRAVTDLLNFYSGH